MTLLYIGLGVLIVIGLHVGLKWLSQVRPDHVKQLLQVVLLLCGLIVIVLLIRFGLPYLAAIVSGFLALTALLGRLLVWFPILRFFQNCRQQASSHPPASSGKMSVEEARDVLGVGPDATKDDIKKAYHQLMQKLHPDQGGNDYLAAKLNEAKDVLLKHGRGKT